MKIKKAFKDLLQDILSIQSNETRLCILDNVNKNRRKKVLIILTLTFALKQSILRILRSSLRHSSYWSCLLHKTYLTE